MQLVINHLTRMTGRRICVAGLETHTNRHVRPVTGPANPLTRDLLAEEGGLLMLGAVVSLGNVVPVPARPEVEDYRIAPGAFRLVARAPRDEYVARLDAVAKNDLQELFGSELAPRGGTYAAEEGSGEASLGVWRPSQRPGLEVNKFGRLRLMVPNGTRVVSLPITDLRFFEPDHKTVRTEVFMGVNERLRRGVRVWVMVGLGRGYAAPGDDRARHWLQVNGVCLEDRPLGSEP